MPDPLAGHGAGFSDPTVAAYRGRVDAAGDVEELRAEMLFADLERIMARVEKLEAAIKKPTPRRDEQTHELELMKRLLSALEAEQPIAEAIHGEAESKLARSFQFLTLKPVLVVVNCGESEAGGAGPPAGDREPPAPVWGPRPGPAPASSAGCPASSCRPRSRRSWRSFRPTIGRSFWPRWACRTRPATG